MSSSLSFNPNTYAGEAASGYITRSLLNARSLSNSLVTVIPNAKKRTVLRRLEQELVFSDATCAFTADGQTLIEERYLDPVQLSVMYELCFKDLLAGWEADMLRGGSGKEQVPQDLNEYLLTQMEQKIALGIEKLMWRGKSGAEFAFTGNFTGFAGIAEADSLTKKMQATVSQIGISAISIANPGIVTVASTAGLTTGTRVTIVGANNATLSGGQSINGQSFTITVISATSFSLNAATNGTATSNSGFIQFINENNVVEVLTVLYKSVPDSVKARADFKMYVPLHVADAYRLRQAQEANGAGSFFTGNKELNFLGKPIEEMPHLPTNTLLATYSGNLFFGTDLLSDFNEVQVVDMRQTTADQKVRYRAQFSAAAQIGFTEEVCLYRPAAS